MGATSSEPCELPKNLGVIVQGPARIVAPGNSLNQKKLVGPLQEGISSKGRTMKRYLFTVLLFPVLVLSSPGGARR
jgi:hypothetical protein